MTAAPGLNDDFVDLLRALVEGGVSFEEAWAGRVELDLAGLSVPFLGREALVRNKQATGREKDLADLRLLSDREPSSNG